MQTINHPAIGAARVAHRVKMTLEQYAEYRRDNPANVKRADMRGGPSAGRQGLITVEFFKPVRIGW